MKSKKKMQRFAHTVVENFETFMTIQKTSLSIGREGAFFDTPSFFMFIRNRKDSHENFP